MDEINPLKNNKTVYIIIPVHNRKEITVSCLAQLKKNGDLDQYAVVVVDDASTDGTSEAIRTLFPEVIILEGDGNLWWTGAIKKGMEYAYHQGADYFIWLNDDCLVKADAVNKLVGFCKQESKAIVGCQGYEVNENEQIAFGGYIKENSLIQLMKSALVKPQDCRTYPQEPYDVLNGNFVCLPRQVVDIVGFPNPKIAPHYFGDFIFTAQAKNRGMRLLVKDIDGVHNTSNERSPTYPKRWLFMEGKPWRPLRLVFSKESILSLKVNFTYFRLLYRYPKGLAAFFVYYIFRIFIPIVIISVLRFFPFSFRSKFSAFKSKIKNTT
ncbi:MAG: glycosyltransferase family 2 protein [Limnothrix sp. RL_2_0]|nr:glycosyltransferase family 2 protein [Limnothrix sp. RL_2_0]